MHIYSLNQNPPLRNRVPKAALQDLGLSRDSGLERAVEDMMMRAKRLLTSHKEIWKMNNNLTVWFLSSSRIKHP